MSTSVIIDNLDSRCADALDAADRLYGAARGAVADLVVRDGREDQALSEANQFVVHGLAWFKTYVETMRQMLDWARRLETTGEHGEYGELEQLLLQALFGEYLTQLTGGIAMSQVEIVRAADFWPRNRSADDALDAYETDAVRGLKRHGNSPAVRARIAELISEGLESGYFGNMGLTETRMMMRNEFRRFAEAEVAPHAHEWHLKDQYIPMEIIRQMGELGVFGLTIPEEYGGLGLSKTAMCVVSEELSRAYIGVGSLGTRSEIAAELILGGGTEAQKQKFLPGIASGEILPTAVFTEPGTGSDLASLTTRAAKDGDTYRVTGNKTWITHAARADIMTLLVRTNPDDLTHRGLSMFIAEKPAGDDETPFPADGMDGSEIEVLGYRGMKEFDIAFDGFAVSADNLLGEKEGQGFYQLMVTFESARIQTAARALGVAQSAMELGLSYAKDRTQFKKPIYEFPRVSGKLAWMAVEIMAARQLTHYAAREKDEGRRCDLEAGMAKLLAARVAWANADNALQIHGGNGFAMEFPISRVLQDARILNIFEGAGEIQAQVISRRLLEETN